MTELNKPVDIKIECPNCKLHNCYETRYTNISVFLCFTCGYTTNSKMIKDSDYVKEQFELNSNVAKFIKDIHFIDIERNLVWYPGVLQFPELGVIFPEPNDDNTDWGWTYVKEIPVLDEEKEKYKIDGTNEYYKTKLDLNNAIRFNKYDFYSAAIAMGVIKPQSNEIN